MKNNFKQSIFVICAVILLLISQNATSKSRIKIIEDRNDFSIINFQPPFLLEEKLLYFSKEDSGQISLWSYDLDTNEHVKLYRGSVWVPEAPRIATPVSNNGLIYFLQGNTFDGYIIWRSDGTTEGTYALDTRRILSGLYSSEDVTFAQIRSNGVSGGLITLNGDQSIIHPFLLNGIVNENDICTFSASQLLYLNKSGKKLLFSNNGNISEIPLPISDDSGAEFVAQEIFHLDGICYISIKQDQNLKEVFMVSSDGSVQQLSDKLPLSEFTEIIKLHNRLFATQSNALYKLNSSLTGFDSQIGPIERGSISDIQTVGDYIALTYIVFPTDPPLPTPTTAFFNKSLSPVFISPDNTLPQANETSSGLVYSITREVNGFTSTEISDDVFFLEDLQFSIKDSFTNKIITDPQTPEVFFLLQNKNSGKRSIELLSEKPGIDQFISGAWYDPAIQNQGISLHAGKRANGSNYLFASIYTYRNGEQLWLAGSTDISFRQESVELPISEFNGGNLFDPNITPSQQTYGSLNLEMTDCNTLAAILSSELHQDLVLSLKRVNNALLDDFCMD